MMQRRTPAAIVRLSVLLLPLLVLTGQTPAPPGYAFSLFYTGNTLGRIEHCLCDNKELGGFAERSKLIQDIQTDQGGSALFFDTGDLIDKRDPALLLNAIKILKRDGYRFVALGEKDLQAMPKDIQDIRAKVNMPLLLTNAPPQMALNQTVREFVNGIRIEFLNVVDWPDTPVDWNVTDPQGAIEDALDHPSGPTDFRVLISHLDPGRTRQLAGLFAGRIHLIIESHEHFSMPEFVSNYARLLGTDPCEQVNRIRADYTVTPAYFDYRVFPVPATAEADPKVLADIAKMRPRGKAPSGGNSPRTGSTVCVGCHKAEADQWKGTAHAIIEKTVFPDNNADAKCTTCHAPFAETGEKSVGCEACHGGGATHVVSAYKRKVDTSAEIPAYGEVKAEVCLTCHAPDKKHIKSFDAKAAWVKILHKPAEAPPAIATPSPQAPSTPGPPTPPPASPPPEKPQPPGLP